MFTELRNSHGEALDFAFHEGRSDAAHLVVLGHGVTANKDRPFLVALAEQVSARGHHVLRISFSGNGASEGLFADSTVSKEVADLGSVLDTIPAGLSVTYVGHSMGGAVGVLRAAQDDRIHALVSLAVYDRPPGVFTSMFSENSEADGGLVPSGPRKKSRTTSRPRGARAKAS